jgi:hypothetical protein
VGELPGQPADADAHNPESNDRDQRAERVDGEVAMTQGLHNALPREDLG